MRLCIVIPTFNERDNVRLIVDRISRALAETPDDYEVLFVDDSTDNTVEVLAEVAASRKEVNYIHRLRRSGLASAVVEGFDRSKSDFIIVMDADLQHPPELLPAIVAKLAAGAEVVIPTRFEPGGSDGGLNAARKLISWTARKIGQLAIRRLRGISDCTGGYFGIRRSVISGAALNPIGWKILIEVLVKGNYTTVASIPYAFHARSAGESKMSLREQWNYLRHLARLVSASPPDRRFYLFCLVGLLGTIVNLAIMTLLMYGFHVYGASASVVASLAAMVHNFLWNDRVTWKGFAQAAPWRRAMQMPLFVLVSSVSVAITAICVQGFVMLHWNELLGQFIGIVAATGWSYMANNRWTWRPVGNKPMGSSTVRVPKEDAHS